MAKYTKYIQFPFSLRVVKKGLIDQSSSPQQNLKIINWVLFLPISQATTKHPTILKLLFGIIWLQNVSRNLVKKSIQVAYEWRVGSFLCPRVNTSYSFTLFFAFFVSFNVLSEENYWTSFAFSACASNQNCTDRKLGTGPGPPCCFVASQDNRILLLLFVRHERALYRPI